jgi:UDP-N-acetylglucosamine--N-acetylmuramyl-(pentapeptide) pyrophosphoryl-undecaprenol N-acetylglucosamine transferase
MKICITGGHVTPAIALISELKSRGQDNIVFIGRKRAMEGDKTPSIESALIPQLGVKFMALNPGRLQRSFTRYTIPALLRTPWAFIQAFFLLLREYPSVVVSFGSYVALPVVVAAWILRIPIVTHEQTLVSGLSNRLIARLANRIAVSYEESLTQFPSKKTVLTGNPVRPEVLEDRSGRFNFSTSLPVIYVTAGNQGSHVINEAVLGVLPDLLERYIVIHQVGAAGFFDDFGTLERRAEGLPTKLRERYYLERYIGPDDIGSVLKRADLVIGRSGANTVSDLAATKVPALFVPLPFATHDEQTKNARLLVNAGSAEILPQRELTPERLMAVTEMMVENLRRYKKAATEAKRLVRPDAAKRLASEVIALAR